MLIAILFLRCCEMLVVYEVDDDSDITFIFWPQGDVSILEQNFSLKLKEMDSYFWQKLTREENIFRLLVIEWERKRVQDSMIVPVYTDKCVRMRVKVFFLFL